jgi:hypothetical protein
MNTKNESVFAKAGKALLYLLVGVVMLYWEPAKFLCRKAYGGKWYQSIGAGLIGLVVSIVSATSAADLAMANNLSIVWWASASFASFFLMGGIIWPLAYIGVFKPLWQAGDRVLDGTRWFAKNVCNPFFKGLTRVARIAPGATALWNTVEEQAPVEGQKHRKRWAVGIFTGVVGIASLALGAAVAYTVYNYFMAVVPTVLVALHANQILAGLIAATATTFVIVPLVQLLDEGKEGYLVAVLSATATWALATQTALFATLGGAALYAAIGGTALAAFVYVVPGIIALLSGGLMEALLKGWKNLLEAAYGEEPNKDFRKFYHNAMNIVVAILAGGVAFYVAGLIALPVLLAWVVAIASALYCYVEALREVTNKDSGNALIGVTVSAASGVAAWFLLPAAVAISGGWLVAACVAIVFAVGLVVHPLAYLVVRLLTGWASAPVGSFLDSVHSGAVSAFAKLRVAIRDMQKKAFNDTSAYSGMFGHLLNLGAITAIVWQGIPLAMGYLTFGFWLNTALAVFVGVNLFMLLGKLCYKWGAESLAFSSGVITLLGSAYWAYGVSGGSIVATIMIATTLASLVGGIIAPALYLVLRPLANLVLTSWLAPALSKSFDFLWSVYEGFWRKFAGIYRLALRIVTPIYNFLARLIAPVIKRIASMIGPVAHTIATIWQNIAAMFGGKKK